MQVNCICNSSGEKALGILIRYETTILCRVLGIAAYGCYTAHVMQAFGRKSHTTWAVVGLAVFPESCRRDLEEIRMIWGSIQ